MKLSAFKSLLEGVDSVRFEFENGTKVPQHFHVTEVGVVSKHFIDCGGTVRTEQYVSFQLWSSHDFLHRLKPKKLLGIIGLCEAKLGIGDFEIEVEYQSDTVGRYGLGFKDEIFVLQSKSTACLAQDNCGIPKKDDAEKPVAEAACCTPRGGCC